MNSMMAAPSVAVLHMNREIKMLTDIEDTIEMYKAKEKAYTSGVVTGLLFGIPLGLIATVMIAWLTVDKWLILIN